MYICYEFHPDGYNDNQSHFEPLLGLSFTGAGGSAGLPCYFYVENLDNLTRIPLNYILCKLAQYSRSRDGSKTVEQIYKFSDLQTLQPS